jgi:hypothetical protein
MEQEIFNRLLIEFNDLNEKIIKCREFLLDEEKVKTLDHLNRDLLIAQLKAQETYLSLLSIRIGLNTPKESVVNSESEESSND